MSQPEQYTTYEPWQVATHPLGAQLAASLTVASEVSVPKTESPAEAAYQLPVPRSETVAERPLPVLRETPGGHFLDENDNPVGRVEATRLGRLGHAALLRQNDGDA